ncbi:MAG: cytochrome c [Sediminibacterium sp.]|nr:cytochrome c [Sediminibacterium sp.]MDP3665239.1 cytochrome c [Sediminibacterium sp.]
MRRIMVMGNILFLLFVMSAFIQTYSLPKSIERGKEVYATFCMNCHMADGKGMENAYPPVAKSDYLKRPVKDLINNVLKGESGELKVNGVSYNAIMPAQDYLTDGQIADVLNYVNNSWGNKNLKAITPEQVKKMRP